MSAEPLTPDIPRSPALVDVAEYRVMFADCDPLRVMYYANYFRLFEIGHTELFRSPWHLFRSLRELGLYLIATEARCWYARSARYDDLLTIRAGLGEIGYAWLRIHYEIARVEGDTLTRGYTNHAAIDESGSPRRLPADFRRKARQLAEAAGAELRPRA